MGRNLVLGAFMVLFLFMIYLASDLKEAYKILPGNTSGQLVVPPFADWHVYTPEPGLFQVSLPAPPQAAHSQVAIPKSDKMRHYQMYVSEKLDGTAMMISLITYPTDYNLKNTQQLFREIVDELLVGNRENRLEDFSLEEIKGYPGARFQIQNPQLKIQGREFLVGNTLYLLNYVATKQAFQEDEFTHFLDSFSLSLPSPDR